MSHAARDLAYLLYRAAEERGDAAEALAYNSLVSALPDMAAEARGSGPAFQQTGFL